MKKQNLQEQLNNYFDAEEFLERYAKSEAYKLCANARIETRLVDLGLDEGEEDFRNLLYEILDNERIAKKRNEEPNRTFIHHCVFSNGEPEEDKEITYTLSDVEFFQDLLAVQQKTYEEFDEYVASITADLIERFNGNVDLIKANCLMVLHSFTLKDVAKEFADRRKRIVASLNFEDPAEFKHIKKLCDFFHYSFYVEKYLVDITKPFTDAMVQIHQEELKGEDILTRNYLGLVFKERREITEEISKIQEQIWKEVTEKSLKELEEEKKSNIKIYNRLAQDKFTNSLRSVRLARDHKEIRTETSNNGKDYTQTQVFENNGVEIILGSSLNNISLSIGSRQLFDFAVSKLTQQIPPNCTDANILKKCGSITFDINEISKVFHIADKKECRKLLENFYYEMRDIKIAGILTSTIGKGKVQKELIELNVFTGSKTSVICDNVNTETGEQLTLHSTGTKFNYNPATIVKNPAVVKNGKLTMFFSDYFVEHISLHASYCQHNPVLYGLNRKKFSPAYNFGYKLETYAYQTRKSTNRNIITIGKLLEADYTLPTYKEVMAGNKNVKARIQIPFFNNIEELDRNNFFTQYSFYDNDRKKTTKEKLLAMDYKTFEKCTLHYDLAEVDKTTTII